MFGFSAGEILLIALIALLLFGNEKLPQNIKKFFKGWNHTKKVAFDLQKSWHEIKYDLQKDINIYESNNLLSEKNNTANDSKLVEPVTVKPAQHLVNQEEIDSHQNILENEQTKETSSI